MIVSLFRIAAKPARLVLGTLCVLALGCGGATDPAASPGPAAAAPVGDERVLLALDCYDPMFQVDENGRVTRLRLTSRHLPTPVMAEIGKLTEIQSLDLAFATVTDEGLAQLKDLQKLRTFGLGHTLVTDAGLPHLEKLQGLHYVWLSKVNFSTEATDKLKNARPGLHVYLH